MKGNRLDPVDLNAPPAMRELAQGLRRAMADADYTVLRVLAEDAQLAASTVSNALSGKSVPSWRTTKFLLQTCGVKPDVEWRKVWEDAKDAEQSLDRSSTDDEPDLERDAVIPRQPGLFSIRPPTGNLPARVRGRDAVLAHLTGLVAEPKPMLQVLHGLGGCGKTTIALETARLAQESGCPVYWVSAAERGGFTAGMREIARELGVSADELEQAWTGQASVMDLLWRYLDAASRPWLLVVDNADDPEILAAPGANPGDGTGWVRPSRTGTTLLTSRVGSPDVWGSQAERHQIGVLADKDAADVLVDLAGHAGDQAQATALAERLGGLPLALRSAGSYLGRTARGAGLLRRPARIATFAAYRQALGDIGTDLLDEGLPRVNETDRLERLHRGLVGRTWEMSFDLLESQGIAQARPLMRLISCLAPAPLPAELLVQDGPDAPSVDDLDRALEALVDLELLTVPRSRGAEADFLATSCVIGHRLVLEATRSRLCELPAAEQRTTWRAATRLITAAAEPAPESPANWNWWRLILPHVAALVAAVPDTDEDLLVDVLRAGIRGYAYMSFSNTFDGATAYGHLVLNRALVLPENHPVRLAARHRALLSGSVSIDLRLREYTDILARQLEVLGPDDPDTLITDHQLAHALSLTQGNLVGLREMRRVAARRSALFGPADPYTLVSQDELVSILFGLDHPDEAEDLLRAVVNDCKRLLGDTDHYTIMWSARLARTLIRRGATDVGLETVLQGYDRRATPLAARVEVAQVMGLLGRLPEAEREYREILGQLRMSGLQRTDRCRGTLRSLARNLIEQDKVGEALGMHAEAVAAADGHAGADDFGLGLRFDHAVLLRETKRWDEAEHGFRALLAEIADGAVDDPEWEPRIRRTLASMYTDLDRDVAAEREARIAVEKSECVYGPVHGRTRNDLWQHARCLEFTNRPSAAIAGYRKCLRAEVQVLPDDHYSLFLTRSKIIRMQVELGETGIEQALAEFFALPWGDKSKSREIEYRRLVIAGARKRFGDPEAAVRCLDELEARYRDEETADANSLCQLLWDFTLLLEDLDRPAEALAKCREHHDLLSALPERRVSSELFADRRVVSLRMQLEEISDAEGLRRYEGLLPGYRGEFGPFADVVLQLRRRIARLRGKLGDVDRAEHELRELVEICRHRREPEDAASRSMSWHLAIFLMDRERFDEALGVLEECHVRELATFEDAKHLEILRTRRRIILCRSKLGLLDPGAAAAGYQELLADLIAAGAEAAKTADKVQAALRELDGSSAV
ncbi:tetratricopeptide repeat protein [Amycolatopsis sp.]|uniref:tetratricopeptide repeat protein n=1 Tax=Amycolatopsis sp. TaxID=37632 RepID=UPI002D7F1700|nr:tetratricopeptide repeat protein [Amycolatopsis sp.]HET6706384.1 tetratricopeptide repeat protein [Amycolatopsis sp.]